VNKRILTLKRELGTLQDTLDRAYQHDIIHLAKEIMTFECVTSYVQAMGQASFKGFCTYTYADGSRAGQHPWWLESMEVRQEPDWNDLLVNSDIPEECLKLIRDHAELCADYVETIGPCYTPYRIDRADNGKITIKDNW
jgi:hypothetical protein